MVNDYSEFLNDEQVEKTLQTPTMPKEETVSFLLSFSKSLEVEQSEQIGEVVFNLN